MSTTLPTKTRMDFERMLDPMEKLFESIWNPISGMAVANTVPLDVYEKENRIFVRAAVPGVKPEEVNVSFEDGTLMISGETKHEFETDPDAKVYRREFRYGKFARSLRLPDNIDHEKIVANFDNGFITIEMPRLAVARPPVKRIPVNSKAKA